MLSQQLDTHFTMSQIFHYDLIIIGGGRASGLAIAAAKAGKKVALIEKDLLGGTCPNRGCVPSKLLLGYAEAAQRVREAGLHHIEASINEIDVAQVFKETNEWSSQVDSRYESRLPDNVTLYRGAGSFRDDHTVEVNGELLSAGQIVIATGARPRPAPYPELPVWTSEDLFPLKGSVPSSITIVGGGFIATELAHFFSAVGIKTTLLVRGERLLPGEDAEISQIFTEEFSKKVSVRLKTSIVDAGYDGSQFTMGLNDGSTHQSEALLYAIGRIPNTDHIGLEKTGIETDQGGFIKRDSRLQTKIPGVYAIGDVAGKYQLQHAAGFEVHYLRQILLKGHDEDFNEGAMPHAVFTNPEIASVGLTEEEAQQQGLPYVAVTEDWLASARAMSTKLTYPRTKLIIRRETFEILGCHLIGPEASTMIHQILMLMHLKNDIREIPKMIHIHPALPEALLAAAVKAINQIKSQSFS